MHMVEILGPRAGTGCEKNSPAAARKACRKKRLNGSTCLPCVATCVGGGRDPGPRMWALALTSPRQAVRFGSV